MTRKSLPLIAALLALSACGGTVNRGLESVHQPIVQRTDYVIDVNATGGVLAAGEQERLDGWFQSIGLAYGDRVAIDDPAGANSGRGEVATLLGRRGMMITPGAPVTGGTISPGAIRVIVSRSMATVPGCPDWSRKSGPEFVGSTMSNYGCAANAALAAMIADPLDLIHGRASGSSVDPTASAKAIKQYREAPPSATRDLKVESTGKSGQ